MVNVVNTGVDGVDGSMAAHLFLSSNGQWGGWCVNRNEGVDGSMVNTDVGGVMGWVVWMGRWLHTSSEAQTSHRAPSERAGPTRPSRACASPASPGDLGV